MEAFSTEDIRHQLGVLHDLMNRLAEGSTDPADHAMLAASVLYTLGAIGELTDRMNDINTRLVEAAAKMWGFARSPGLDPLPLAEKD